MLTIKVFTLSQNFIGGHNNWFDSIKRLQIFDSRSNFKTRILFAKLVEFINENMEYLPNFVETYGVYKYNNDSEYEEMKKLTAGKDALSGLSLIRTPSDATHPIEKERNLLKIAEQHIKEKI